MQRGAVMVKSSEIQCGTVGPADETRLRVDVSYFNQDHQMPRRSRQ